MPVLPSAVIPRTAARPAGGDIISGKMMNIFTLTRDYLGILKLRIVVVLVLVAVMTAVVAGRGSANPGALAWLALAGGLASAGSSLLNNYLDRDIDATMNRTRRRPLPQGRIGPRSVLVIGLLFLALSLLAALRLNLLVALFVASGAGIYVVLYTLWLKRRSALNIVIGGLAGSCAVLAGWFSVTAELSLTPLLIALILFLWTPSHFWSFALAHQESYQQGGVPMLPVRVGGKRTAHYILLHSASLIAAALSLYLLGPWGKVYLLGSLLLAGLFLASSIGLWRDPQKSKAWLNYKVSGVFLVGLFLIMALDVMTQ